MRREQGHLALDGIDGVGRYPFDDVLAPLAVTHAAVEQVRDVGRLGGLADDDMRATQFGGIGSAHRRMHRARRKTANGAVLVGDRIK